MKLLQYNPTRVLLITLIFSALACNLPENNIDSPPKGLDLITTTETPTTSTIATIENSPLPVGLPNQRAAHITDVDSSANATRKIVSGGDKFVSGLYERPFNAENMDTYFPYIDIVDAEGFNNDVWGVATITLAGLNENGKLSGNYAVELDLDADGRGDWLIYVSTPSSISWTTQGVKIFEDTNDDVGSKSPAFADDATFGDGYETLSFDNGKGEPSDSAFARISPGDPKKIDITFKLSAVGNPKSFAMGAWAGNDSLSPTLFDFNDNFTHEQAGSPLPDLNTYPLKELAEIDNTCRMAINFVPNGSEPGLCSTMSSANGGDGGGSHPPCGTADGGVTCKAWGCNWVVENNPPSYVAWCE